MAIEFIRESARKLNWKCMRKCPALNIKDACNSVSSGRGRSSCKREMKAKCTRVRYKENWSPAPLKKSATNLLAAIDPICFRKFNLDALCAWVSFWKIITKKNLLWFSSLEWYFFLLYKYTFGKSSLENLICVLRSLII